MSGDAFRPGRRRALRCAAFGVGALAVHGCAARATASELPRLRVDDPWARARHYVPVAAESGHPDYTPGERCADCRLYTGPGDAAYGTCALFQGKRVAADGWCSLWEAVG